MKSVYALAAAGLLALSVPALAESAGSPGASGTGSAKSNTDANKMGGSGGSMNGGMNEGRAAAPNQTNTPADPANPAPDTVRGGQNGQPEAK